jgi:hypothetical protein
MATGCRTVIGLRMALVDARAKRTGSQYRSSQTRSGRPFLRRWDRQLGRSLRYSIESPGRKQWQEFGWAFVLTRCALPAARESDLPRRNPSQVPSSSCSTRTDRRPRAVDRLVGCNERSAAVGRKASAERTSESSISSQARAITAEFSLNPREASAPCRETPFNL